MLRIITVLYFAVIEECLLHLEGLLEFVVKNVALLFVKEKVAVKRFFYVNATLLIKRMTRKKVVVMVMLTRSTQLGCQLG